LSESSFAQALLATVHKTSTATNLTVIPITFRDYLTMAAPQIANPHKRDYCLSDSYMPSRFFQFKQKTFQEIDGRLGPSSEELRRVQGYDGE
jgi:hypothetical protein